MEREAGQVLFTPEFSYMGFKIPPLIVPGTLVTNLRSRGKPVYEQARDSSPLPLWVGLYTVGRDLAFGGKDAKALPEPVRNAGKMVYHEYSPTGEQSTLRGVVHNDAILFEPRTTIKGNIKPGKDYVAARSFREIRGFKRENGKWDIVPSPETKESRVWVPPGERYIVPGRFHPAYDPETGLPIETIGDRDEAIRRWTEAGLTRAQAIKELSRAYRGDGLCAVYSFSEIKEKPFSGNQDGPLSVYLNYPPDDTCNGVAGSAPIRDAEIFKLTYGDVEGLKEIFADLQELAGGIFSSDISKLLDFLDPQR